MRKCTTAPPTYKKMYRDALLCPAPLAISHPRSPLRSLPCFGRPSFAGKCLRCLGRDHRVFTCRNSIRCRRCFKLGHFARYYMNQLPMNVYRAMRARPTYLSAFVPLSEDFFARQNRPHNAVVIDVASPANLGHFPQDTIAFGLANRFGGYPSDFHVAHYSERDFVIFLPEWVPCEQLLCREILSLGDLKLCCYPWDPYRGARQPSLTYKA